MSSRDRSSSSVIPGSPIVFGIAIISSPSAPNLPLHGRVLGLWELCDVIAGVLELEAFRQHNCIVDSTHPRHSSTPTPTDRGFKHENENRVCTKVSPV